jgi:plasmid stabilization system protein ParE
MTVRLHPEARAELREARRWYFERSPLSATAFAHGVDNAVARIVESPTG